MKQAFRQKIIRPCFYTATAVVLLIALFAPALPASAAPVITLVPSSGPVGTSVTIQGSVFDSYIGDTIHIFFGDREIDTSPITLTDGSFSTSFNIPADTAAGQHWIEIRSETTSTSMIAKNYFMVDAIALALDTTQGPTGSSIVINGSGFYVGSTVTVSYYNPDAQNIGTVAASAAGKFTKTLVIPTGTAGLHNISAVNDYGNAAQIQFRVVPQIKLSLDAAGPGDTLNVRGTGFAATSVVNVFFGAQSMPISITTTDGTGSFSTLFNVPDVQPTSYDIKCMDDKGNSDSAAFTVSASAKLSEDTGAVGNDITIQGGGFGPGETVTIYYDGVPIATTSADNNGNFSVVVTIPRSDGGKHTITISDSKITRNLTFNVETNPPPIPALQLPADASLTRAETYFDWSDVTDPSVPVTYDLQIAADANFASVLVSKTGIADSQYTLSGNEVLAAGFKNAPYYWRVRAIDGAGNVSEWSAPWLFYVSVPDVPQLVQPLTDAKTQYPIRFTWQGVHSLSEPVTYSFQIAADLDFNNPVLEKTGLENFETSVSQADSVKLKKGVIYYWRVNAVDAAHNASGWSAAGSFLFSPPSAFPGWATGTLISIGGLMAVLLAFRFGRKTAYH